MKRKNPECVTVVAAGSAKKADSEDSEESKVKAIVSITVIDKQEPPMFDDEATTTPRIRPRDRYGRRSRPQ